MNSKLNLWKDKELKLKYKNEDITQEMILKQTKKCENTFDEWHLCIKRNSFNDEKCVGQLKPKYEYCIQKRNYMQTIFDERLDELDV